jgi:hypothetical protein
MAYGSHLLENVSNRSVSPETMQRLALHLEQIGQLVRLLVWCG